MGAARQAKTAVEKTAWMRDQLEVVAKLEAVARMEILARLVARVLEVILETVCTGVSMLAAVRRKLEVAVQGAKT